MRRVWVGLFLLWALGAGAQTVSDLDPHLTAMPTDGGMLLRWQTLPAGAGVLQVRRRDAGASSFGAIASLDGGTSSWFIPEALGERTEFNVQRGSSNAWVMAGEEVPFRDDQGVVVLVVDAAQSALLSAKLSEWEADLRDDGWAVVRESLAGNEAPPELRARLQSRRAELGDRLRAVFLFGRVPRAFSGVINPDGHPDHLGAWPADPYYGDLDGTWTDVARGGTGSFANDAGDGKFDQSVAPSKLEVAVGRVDFEAMPAFGPDAGIALLERYLDKAHAFRSGQIRLPQRVLVDDNFGYFGGEAFARIAWRDGTAITGEPPQALDLFTTLNSPDGGYLLAFGCGGGNPTGAGGVGNTANFVNGAPQAVFVGLFGSYFGDWNYPDNFLRAALATRGPVLATLWFARPSANLHSLGALETFGDAFRRGFNGQASPALYGSSSMRVHQALLADPTLRLFYPLRLSGLGLSIEGQGVRATWPPVASPGLLGYHLFRRPAASTAAEERITAEPLAATTFLDQSAPADALLEYRAVPVVRQSTGSGTFWNHALGARAQVLTPGFLDDGGVDAGSFVDGGDPGGERADGGDGAVPDDEGPPIPLPLEPGQGCGCKTTAASHALLLLAALGLWLGRGQAGGRGLNRGACVASGLSACLSEPFARAAGAGLNDRARSRACAGGAASRQGPASRFAVE